LNKSYNLPSPDGYGPGESYDTGPYASLQTWGTKTMILNEEATVQSDGSLLFTSTQFYPPTSEAAKYSFVGIHPRSDAVIQKKSTVATGLNNTYPNRLDIYYNIKGYNDIMIGMAQEDYDSAYSAVFQKTADVTKDGVATGKSGDELRPKIKFRHILTQLNFRFKNASTNASTEPVYIDSIVVINQYKKLVIHVDLEPVLDGDGNEILNKDTLSYWWDRGEGDGSTAEYPISVRDENHHDSLLLENVITVPEVQAMYEAANPTVTDAEVVAAGTKALRKELMAEYAVPLRNESFKKIGGSLMLLSQNDGPAPHSMTATISGQVLKTFELYVYTRTYDQTIGYASAGLNAYKQNFKGDGQHTHARALVKAPNHDSGGFFEPGKAYNINVSLGSNTEIKVDAELTEWVNGGDVEAEAE
jgi:hypothetical protein